MSIINEYPYDTIFKELSKERKIIYLTYGGSHAYGTNNEQSDIDIRGIALKTKSELLGFSQFEQFQNLETDTTVYSVDKFFKLALNCNPNVIEFLGTKEEHKFLVSSEGQMLLDNKDIFLSSIAIDSFGGYATSQLRRLENYLSTKISQADKEVHILATLNNMQGHLQRSYSSYEKSNFKMYEDITDRKDFEKEIFVDVDLKRYPLRDFYSIQSEMTSAIKAYDKLNHRNSKKDDQHLNKHTMHLIRLNLMLLDILEKREINTYRVNDIPLLMGIRNGDFAKDNYAPLYELLGEQNKQIEYAKKHTTLPKEPNYKKAEELLVSINEMSLL